MSYRGQLHQSVGAMKIVREVEAAVVEPVVVYMRFRRIGLRKGAIPRHDRSPDGLLVAKLFPKLAVFFQDPIYARLSHASGRHDPPATLYPWRT